MNRLKFNLHRSFRLVFVFVHAKRVFSVFSCFLVVLLSISAVCCICRGFSLRGETIIFVRVKYSHREDNVFSSRGEFILFGFDGENEWRPLL